jgi:hypothetical protein
MVSSDCCNGVPCTSATGGCAAGETCTCRNAAPP